MQTVVVTGAGGYIASHVVQQLLLRGDVKVRGTVRSTTDEAKVGFLKRLEGASERLELFEADLMKAGSFDTAIKDSDIVLHMASPFLLSDKIKDPQRDVIDPALMGTRNVLEAVNRAPTVKRVVLTSSQMAVHGDFADRSEGCKGGHTFTESDWNESSSIEHQPYGYSKTIAEREAWMMVGQQTRWQLVVINPSFVLGPTLSGRNDSSSISFMINYLDGTRKSGVPNLGLGIVDVRDVARAHIEAAFNPAASGRYICCNKTMTMLQLANALRDNYGKYPLPSTQLPKFLIYLVGPILGGLSWKYISRNVGVPLILDNSKIRRELNIEFRDENQTLNEMAASVLEHKLVAERK
ncbi:nucleoside-diphosphate-sugar epimerase [Capsaspora owczarzaki ATCC 30864]|uniref:Nucleoside-diphosphate-sugar epimerase n=1 Tax=Capsaspora owczarzaki (strain ATCC 30864) TaxID=595528 RepID=A0A0D2VQ65_CAPO3|nr:nucleoside-diphosphate-sugar epimerase [Capsaspora owczarzaki ATCC 30864]KJE92727.1 nucleoside-diphosphate-sugar epimerase [Capsaspora owczarzaki ATCC 30864]|eukprot:XP_004363369.1 nucleoside-diphosphate-sugar epimerase [Capsaspora owczarzaki ATCC 30864]